MQHNTMPHNTIPHNAMLYNRMRHNTIKHNTLQHNAIRPNAIQHNSIKHNATQHNALKAAAIGLLAASHIWQHQRILYRVWSFCLTISHLNCALFHGICVVPFTNSLILFVSPGPGLGSPLYKFHR